jgi:hypothetical protein
MWLAKVDTSEPCHSMKRWFTSSSSIASPVASALTFALRLAPLMGCKVPKASSMRGRIAAERASSCSNVIAEYSTCRLGISASLASKAIAVADGAPPMFAASPSVRIATGHAPQQARECLHRNAFRHARCGRAFKRCPVVEFPVSLRTAAEAANLLVWFFYIRFFRNADD